MEARRADVDNGQAPLPAIQGSADMADYPLRRRLRDLGERHALAHRSAARRRRSRAGTAWAATVTSQDPGSPHERRVRLSWLPHPVETQERLGQVVRLHLHRRPAGPGAEGEDSCPDTQDIAAGPRARADQARPDHARVGELLQVRRGQVDLQQAGRLHLVEAGPHAAGPPQLELGTAPPPPDRCRRTVADRGGRDRVLPAPRRDGLPLRLPGEQDPIPMATCEPRLMAAAVESPLPGDRHGGFGERSGETGRWQHRNRAPGRLSGPTGLLIPARCAARPTIRAAPWRSSRRPSAAKKTGPSLRSPTAKSIARAVRGASGIVTTLPPLRVMTKVRCPRSTPKASMLAPVASETRSPLRASSETSACSAGAPRPAATSSAPRSLRSRPIACD